MILHDITRDIVSAPVYLGDPETDFQWVKRIDCGDDYNLSKIKFSSHAGTHVDAPKHFIDDGNSVSDLSIARFFGSCTVVTIDGVLTGEDMENLLPFCKKKVIFHGDGNVFLSQSAAFVMADYGISLVGTDGVSIAFEIEEERVHRELALNDIVVLESLDLTNIIDGDYTLAAFPLKIDTAEAAPVRAVLLEQEKGI
ncbi:MAG TPA: cyclase family protein [Clostridiales bacterium]|nr:cyclase family protein [Clostridiales bacterium]